MNTASRRDSTTDAGRNGAALRVKGGSNGGGFTLIELMVVVVIVLILLAIAYPIYSHYVSESRRTAAITALQQAASAEEKFYALHNKYAELDKLHSSYDSNSVSIPSAQKKWYTLAAAISTDTSTGLSTYTLTATPAGVQQTTDQKDCGTYTLKSDGERSVSGKKTAAKCWGSG